MNLVSISPSHVLWEGVLFDCNIGKDGFIQNDQKKEGDKKTPCGSYQLLNVYYRPDRVQKPETLLPLHEITPSCAWCDDVNSIFYNKYFNLSAFEKPFPSHESLHRDDHLYDILITLNHNTEPTIPGKGSAIFIHTINPDEERNIKPSLGCLKLHKHDLLYILKKATPTTHWVIPEGIINTRFEKI